MSGRGSIKLGLMPPLTGIVGMYGEEITRAGRIACALVNEEGGVLGRPLELVIEDDGSMPGTAVPAAEALVDDHGCAAIIGNLLSNSRIAVANRVVERRKIPYLNFSFYEGSISSRFFFHFAALPNQQIDRMIPALARRYGPKMFFAGANYEWPLGSIDAAKRCLLTHGGEVVGERYLKLGADDGAIGALLERVALSGADVFVPYFAGTDQIRVLERFAAAGLRSRMAVVMGHFDEVMAGALRPHVRDGLYSSNTYFMTAQTKENGRYLERLAALPDVDGIWPEGSGKLTNFGEGTYVCVRAFARAAIIAGTTSGQPLLDALGTVSVEGPQGRVQMDPETQHAVVNTYLARCDSRGAFSIIESFGALRPKIPSRYRQEFDLRPLAGAAGEGEARTSLPGESTSGIGIVALSPERALVHANRAALALWGLSGVREAQVVDRDAGRGLWCQPQALLDALDAVDRGEEWRGLLWLKPVRGVSFAASVSIDRNIDGTRRGSGYVLALSDPRGDGRDGDRSMKTDQAILAVTDVAVVATNGAGVILSCNEGANELFGYVQGEMIGMSIHLLLPPRFRSLHRRALVEFVRSGPAERRMGRRGELAGYRKDGVEFPVRATISKFRRDGRWTLVATLRDVSDEKRAQDELVFRATHDELTNLPNRVLMKDRLANALKRSRRSSSCVATFFVDLDGFKLINDNYGHEAGDEVLKKVATRLVQVLRPGDTIARFGGDEFVVLCEQVADVDAAHEIAGRIVSGLRRPMMVEGKTHFVTGSIGIAMDPTGEMSPEDLLKRADTAMYVSKGLGRDQWRIFNEEMEKQSSLELRLGNGLRSAITNAEMVAFFQPIVAAGTGQIVGAEALLRWHLEGEQVPPDTFIPIAERNGTINQLGEWVLDQACKTQKLMGAALPSRTIGLAVNLSARQLSDPGLCDRFNEILEANDADPAGITLEVTESSLMRNPAASIEVLQCLGDRGFSLAIDDFGTGFSSLSYLQRMPVGEVKIDKSFVDGIGRGTGSSAIVRAIIDMSHALGLTVVAEGVETGAQASALKAYSCDRLQGFRFHRPMPMEEFLSALDADQREDTTRR